MYFKNWFESQLGFSREYRDVEISNIPTEWLVWLMRKNATTKGGWKHFTPQKKQEVESVLKSRNVNWKQPQAQQPVQPQAPQPAPQQQGGEWVYAKAIKDHMLFAKGKDLAVRQRPDKQWEYVVLDLDINSKGARGELTSDEVRSGLIESYRKDGRPIKSMRPSLEDLYQQLGKPVPGAEQPKQKMKMIPDNMISDEQKKIVERFGQMFHGNQ